MPSTFLTDLSRFGPGKLDAPYPLPLARSYCTRLATTHYENFTVASVLLPRRLIRHFHAIYAYCRWADDLGDETGGGARALELLRWWRGELMRCYDGKPRHPVMVALHETIRRFAIPPKPFLDLLFAFEQDQLVKRYRAFDQLLEYCRHSANPVGHLVLYLFESFTPENARLGDCVCTGLQLANFWQDVRRDLDIDRVYLPDEDRRDFGYSDSDLYQRRYSPQFAALMQFEVGRARRLLEEGMALVEQVPLEVQADVELFVRGGLGILGRIEAIRYNVWAVRPTLGKWAKAGLVGQALWRRMRQRWGPWRSRSHTASARLA
jgi:squalene synthase HpnC